MPQTTSLNSPKPTVVQGGAGNDIIEEIKTRLDTTAGLQAYLTTEIPEESGKTPMHYAANDPAVMEAILENLPNPLTENEFKDLFMQGDKKVKPQCTERHIITPPKLWEKYWRKLLSGFLILWIY